MPKKKKVRIFTSPEPAEQEPEPIEQEPEAEVAVKVEPLRVLSPKQIASREHAHKIKIIKQRRGK